MNSLRLLFFFLLSIVLASCGKSNSSPQPARPLVLVSIPPYQLFAERIGGEWIEVRSVVPLGANVHTYEPTLRQMESLEKGELWFRIGEPCERSLLALFEKKLRIIDLREGIDPIEDGCCGKEEDRHFWMSPKIAQIQTKKIAQILAEQFPDHRADFEANAEVLIAELEILDQEIHVALAHLKDGILLVSHPAFGYFCRDYCLQQFSVEIEGKDPRPKQLELLLMRLQEHLPEVAIALPQVNNRGTQLIAQELNLPLTTIDPYAHEYFEMMHSLTESIHERH